MSAWYEKIKSYYKSGLWTKAQVLATVEKGAITEAEAREILKER